MKNQTFYFALMILFLMACNPLSKELPNPSLILPENGAITNDDVYFLAENLNEKLSPFNIATVEFEYSNDRQNWISFEKRMDLTTDFKGSALTTWDALLQAESLSSGTYYSRVTMESNFGKKKTSEVIEFVVNNAPVPNGSALDGELRGEVIFNANVSVDPEGQLMTYEWDFGDGESDSSAQVSHTYQDLDIPYEVTLTVADSYGGIEMDIYDLKFENGELVTWQKAPSNCICTKVVLRGDNLPAEVAAFGPDAKSGGTVWPKSAGLDDGKKLGPVHDNPENASFPGGEKKNTSFGFELYFEVTGNPKDCKEGQLLKGTVELKDGLLTKEICEANGGTWNAGTSTCSIPLPNTIDKLDKDQDGTVDLDVSTKPLCSAAGGKWDAVTKKCTVTFPKSGDKYGDDNYRAKYTFKKHPGKKVIWYDTPMFRGITKNSTGSQNGDFVAYLRGTDGKYCFSCFTFSTIKKAGKDTETLTETDNKVGQASLPAKVK